MEARNQRAEKTNRPGEGANFGEELGFGAGSANNVKARSYSDDVGGAQGTV